MNTDVNVTEILKACFGSVAAYEDRTEFIKSNQRKEIFYVCLGSATLNMRHYKKITQPQRSAEFSYATGSQCWICMCGVRM